MGNTHPVYVMYTADFRQKLAGPPRFVAEEPQRRDPLLRGVKRGNLYVEQGIKGMSAGPARFRIYLRELIPGKPRWKHHGYAIV